MDEYARDEATGKYALAREGVEFSQYLGENGFKIIPVTSEEQLQYVHFPTLLLSNLSLSLRILSKTLEDQKIVVRRDQMTGK